MLPNYLEWVKLLQQETQPFLVRRGGRHLDDHDQAGLVGQAELAEHGPGGLFPVHQPGPVDRAGVSQGGPPDPAVIAGIRARHDIEQLTPMRAGPPR